VAKRRAVDTYREKKAEALRLEAAGTPANEIAEKLSTPLTRIRKWLGKESPTGKKQRKRRR
jgi:predicted transcriptional regulator